MKTLIIGLGTQGIKRKEILKSNYYASVDPKNPNADFKSINEVPINNFDAGFVCVPDEEKSYVDQVSFK